MITALGNAAIMCVVVVATALIAMFAYWFVRWMRSFDDFEAKRMAEADANRAWNNDLDLLDDQPLQDFADAVEYSRGIAKEARERGLPEKEVMALKRKAINDYQHGRVENTANMTK